MCSLASVILTSIGKIFVGFETISIQSLELLRISKVDINVIDVTILANIALAGENIFQVLAQYSCVLPQYLRVLSQFLQVLSR